MALIGFLITLSLYADVSLAELWDQPLRELVDITDAELEDIERDCC